MIIKGEQSETFCSIHSQLTVSLKDRQDHEDHLERDIFE